MSGSSPCGCCGHPAKDHIDESGYADSCRSCRGILEAAKNLRVYDDVGTGRVVVEGYYDLQAVLNTTEGER